MVNVKAVGEKYRCNICGNEVEVTKAGGGELVCCGQAMAPLEEAVTGVPEEAPAEAAPVEVPSETEEAVEEAGAEAGAETSAPEGEEPRPEEGI